MFVKQQENTPDDYGSSLILKNGPQHHQIFNFCVTRFLCGDHRGMIKRRMTLLGAGKQLKTMKQIAKPDFNTRMKREMKSLQRNIKAAEKSYGESLFNLTVARSYIKKLLGNAKIAAYLKANHPDIFSEFKAIATAEAL